MGLSQLHRLGRSACNASSMWFGRLGELMSPAPPVDVTNLEHRLRAVRSLTALGFMALQAVRRDDQIVDFEWDFADAQAVRLMAGGADSLIGRRLIEVLAGRPGRGEIFQQYRRVVEFGAARPVRHWVEVNASPSVLRHAAVRLHDGVAVTLTNVSTVRRELALQREIAARSAMVATGTG